MSEFLATPRFVQAIIHAIDWPNRTADVRLGASPSLLLAVPLPSHIYQAEVGDIALVMLPDPDSPALSPLITDIIGRNRPKPSFTIPLGSLDLDLTADYQDVTEYTQAYDSTFTVLAGLARSLAIMWNLYVMLTLNYPTNPSTVEVAIYHYWQEVWQYHPTTYSRTRYAASQNKDSFGPWPVSEVSETIRIRARVTAGTSHIYGTNRTTDASIAALLFLHH